MRNGHLEEVVVGSLVNGPFAPLLLFLFLHWHFCVYFDTSSLFLCFFCPSLFSINYNYLHFHILLFKLILVMFVAFLIRHQFFVLLHVFSAYFSLCRGLAIFRVIIVTGFAKRGLICTIINI